MATSKSPKKTAASDESAPLVDASSAVPVKEPKAGSEPASGTRRIRGARFWRVAWIPAVAGGLGLLLGIALGAASQDPTASEEYRGLAAELKDSQSALKNAKSERDELRSAQGALMEMQAEVDSRESELETRAADLDAREAAVTAIEARIRDTTIREGVWLVGTDIEPGTYRTSAEASSGYCYWAIEDGSNFSHIVDNDIVTGGRPTVTLQSGQQFTTHDCGSWLKQ